MNKMMKVFAVMYVTRTDVLMRASMRINEKKAEKLCSEISDTDMEYLARKMGGIMMSGGGYWDAIDVYLDMKGVKKNETV